MLPRGRYRSSPCQPSYFYHDLKESDDRNAQLIPLSGKCLSLGEPSPAAKNSFIDTIIRPAFEAKPFQRIVFIDHVRSGASIEDLIELLKQEGVISATTAPSVLNLAYKNYQPQSRKDPAIDWLPDIVVGNSDVDFERLDRGQVGRLLPYYPREVWEFDWHIVPNPDQQIGDAIIRTISTQYLPG